MNVNFDHKSISHVSTTNKASFAQLNLACSCEKRQLY